MTSEERPEGNEGKSHIYQGKFEDGLNNLDENTDDLWIIHIANIKWEKFLVCCLRT